MVRDIWEHFVHGGREHADQAGPMTSTDGSGICVVISRKISTCMAPEAIANLFDARRHNTLRHMLPEQRDGFEQRLLRRKFGPAAEALVEPASGNAAGNSTIMKAAAAALVSARRIIAPNRCYGLVVTVAVRHVAGRSKLRSY